MCNTKSSEVRYFVDILYKSFTLSVTVMCRIYHEDQCLRKKRHLFGYVDTEKVHNMLIKISDAEKKRVMRELVEELTKLLSIIYQQSWLTGEVPDDWKVVNVIPITQKGIQGGPGQLQACQPDLSAWQGYGVDHPECNHTAPTGGTEPASMSLGRTQEVAKIDGDFSATPKRKKDAFICDPIASSEFILELITQLDNEANILNGSAFYL
ncbi:hypothetical protein BTVI_45595 [Pitangus sulphuratus]|nr:hypothetical protein BTVI_45595 [Pitangus sulphuratus]